MDNSTRFGVVREAVRRALIHLQERAAYCMVWLMIFDTMSRLLASPGSPEESLRTSLRALDAVCPVGGTCFLPPLREATYLFRIAPPGSSAIRKVLLFISDGHDGGPSPLEEAEQLKHAGVEIHCIGVGNSRDEVAEDLLKNISSWDYKRDRPFYTFIKDGELLADQFLRVAGRLVVSQP